MHNVFVYGSLMNDEVLACLIEGPFRKIEATLHAYKRVKVINATFPALISDDKSRVEGMLIFGVTPDQIKTLDDFEGDYYKRITVEVDTKDKQREQCETYLFRDEYKHFLRDEEWDNRIFREKHLQAFIRRHFSHT